MVTLFTKGFPLGKVVGTLFLNVGLRVGPVGTMKLLSDWIFDFDGFNLVVKSR